MSESNAIDYKIKKEFISVIDRSGQEISLRASLIESIEPFPNSSASRSNNPLVRIGMYSGAQFIIKGKMIDLILLIEMDVYK